MAALDRQAVRATVTEEADVEEEEEEELDPTAVVIALASTEPVDLLVPFTV